MSRMSRIGRIAAFLAVAGALLLPASSALAGGPVATKSGALINYLTTGNLKIGKRITVPFACVATCNVTSTVTLKGPGIHLSETPRRNAAGGRAERSLHQAESPAAQGAKGHSRQVQAGEQRQRDGSGDRRDRRDLPRLQAEEVEIGSGSTAACRT